MTAKLPGALDTAAVTSIVETRVKERLTGAIIVVALVVLLVPELLTGAGGPASVDESPAAETEEQRLKSYTIELVDQPRGERIIRRGAERPAAPVGQPQPAGPPMPVEAPAAPAVAQSRPEPVPAPQAAPPAASAPVNEKDGKAEQPAPRAVTSGSAPAPSKPPAPAQTQARAEAPPAAPSREPPPAKAVAKGWAVQVGSFASQNNANRLAGELKGKGFAAFIAEGTSGGRKLYRVRVGPEADRDGAQALAAKLRSAGRTGTVVPHP